MKMRLLTNIKFWPLSILFAINQHSPHLYCSILSLKALKASNHRLPSIFKVATVTHVRVPSRDVDDHHKIGYHIGWALWMDYKYNCFCPTRTAAKRDSTAGTAQHDLCYNRSVSLLGSTRWDSFHHSPHHQGLHQTKKRRVWDTNSKKW